mmetsp:Transcript_13479/g.33906  ORF Transcript_13479/g.33906 Transcript_13479/m.33906 type:complete len:82 (+) Transcript_13479:162-407(+)
MNQSIPGGRNKRIQTERENREDEKRKSTPKRNNYVRRGKHDLSLIGISSSHNLNFEQIRKTILKQLPPTNSLVYATPKSIE